jgi:hypothetical protein
MDARRDRASASRSSLARSAWLAAVLVVAPLGVLWVWRAEVPPPAGAAPAAAVAGVQAGTRRETRPTLDPARFVGKARLAHQVAREIPDVLDQLYCYCQCDRHLGHRSLLSCYTDGHAAT